jgi:hypothetical protein
VQGAQCGDLAPMSIVMAKAGSGTTRIPASVLVKLSRIMPCPGMRFNLPVIATVLAVKSMSCHRMPSTSEIRAPVAANIVTTSARSAALQYSLSVCRGVTLLAGFGTTWGRHGVRDAAELIGGEGPGRIGFHLDRADVADRVGVGRSEAHPSPNMPLRTTRADFATEGLSAGRIEQSFTARAHARTLAIKLRESKPRRPTTHDTPNLKVPSPQHWGNLRGRHLQKLPWNRTRFQALGKSFGNPYIP